MKVINFIAHATFEENLSEVIGIISNLTNAELVIPHNMLGGLGELTYIELEKATDRISAYARKGNNTVYLSQGSELVKISPDSINTYDFSSAFELDGICWFKTSHDISSFDDLESKVFLFVDKHDFESNIPTLKTSSEFRGDVTVVFSKGYRDGRVYNGALYKNNKVLCPPYHRLQSMKVFDLEADIEVYTYDNTILAKNGVYGHYDHRYNAAVFSIQAFMRNLNKTKVVIGYSGGLDSTVVAAMAVDAMGAENVSLVMMPGPYTSKESIKDAKANGEALEALGARYEVISIKDQFEASLKALQGSDYAVIGVTMENIQARLRMVNLMAISNETGALLFGTTNKSEGAVGYGTIYGDVAGAFNPLRDIPKSELFDIARKRNEESLLGLHGRFKFPHLDGLYRSEIEMPISPDIINKQPSAELSPDQKDSDNLPAYDILDRIVTRMVRDKMTALEIAFAEEDIPMDDIVRVVDLYNGSAYKRQIAPSGPILSNYPL